MATKKSVPKFHREAPEVRREALIEATLQCLRRHGHDGVSVRRISAAAGVSIGLINHHFPSKSGLIAEAYETLSLSLLESMRRQTGDPTASARERLSGYIRASFGPENLDPQLFNVWLVFWSMVAHSPAIRAVHERTYAKYRATLESLLAELLNSGAAPPFRLRAAAITLTALLDGFWVELSLSSATFKPREAISMCEDWITALCSGALPRLLRSPGRDRAIAAPPAGKRRARVRPPA